MENKDDFKFFNGAHALKGLQSSGYKSTDYAVAELIDNSIQAGLERNQTQINVEVISIEKRKSKRTSIEEIIVIDDCGGMDPDTLRASLGLGKGSHLEKNNQRGMGKFGYGLPNASINSCNLTNVYSWQNSACYTTKIDVDNLTDIDAVVPEPVRVNIPEKFATLSNLTSSKGGTIVSWSKLRNPSWTTHTGLFRHTAFLVGRMYRYFLQDGNTTITLRSFIHEEDGSYTPAGTGNVEVLPNDPLFLMENTQTASADGISPNFQIEPTLDNGTKTIPVVIEEMGINSEVTLNWSRAKDETRKLRTDANGKQKQAGDLPFGKDAKKNTGVSIVRAGRELELTQQWNPNLGAELQRWWGMEICFGPELDDIFGVTNNKQAAIFLKRRSYADEKGDYDIDKTIEFQEWVEENLPKDYPIFEITREVEKILTRMAGEITNQNAGQKTGGGGGGGGGIGPNPVTDPGPMEPFDTLSPEEQQKRVSILAEKYTKYGYGTENAENLARNQLENNMRYHFIAGALSSYELFVPSYDALLGTYTIHVNSAHPGYEGFTDLVTDPENNDLTNEHPTRRGIGLLFAAWALLEYKTDDEKEKYELQFIRQKWGKLVTDFFR